MTENDKNRQLNQKQVNAIELLLQGKTDGEIAESVEVSRQTVNEWKNHNPKFIAELNYRRQMIWGNQVERLRGLLAIAVDTIESDLKSDDEKIRQAAAVHILRCTGIYGEDLKPPCETTPSAVEKKWQKESLMEDLFRFQ